MIKLKRVYEPPSEEDGFRILVERLWPRGLAKEEVAVDLWLKEIAPSTELRKWFGHDPGKWEIFRERYWNELEKKPNLIKMLFDKTERKNVTFIFSTKDNTHNGAVVLKEFLNCHKNGETCYRVSENGKCKRHMYIKL